MSKHGLSELWVSSIKLTVYWCGYGSIPIDTFLVGWTSINPSYFGVHQGYQGFDPSPCPLHPSFARCRTSSSSPNLPQSQGARHRRRPRRPPGHPWRRWRLLRHLHHRNRRETLGWKMGCCTTQFMAETGLLMFFLRFLGLNPNFYQFMAIESLEQWW